MKYFIIFLMTLLCCGCTISYPTHPVSTPFLRGEYVKSVIQEMDEYQFAGDAEASFEGDVELFKEIKQQATEVFPDGEYMTHVGRRDTQSIEGYVFHAALYWGGYNRQIYRKESK